MKKFVQILLLLFIINGVKAQENEGLKKHYLKVYSQGLAYNDVSAAINALHGYLAIDNSINYKDTLSMLYFSIKKYYSALLLGEEVYKTQPDNVGAIARSAECYDELGDPKTSVTLFEQVVPKTKDPYHIYKMAVGQYQLKRAGECEQSAKAILADTSSKKVGVNFTSSNGTSQVVPVNAAAANLLGVLQMDVKNYTAAKASFERAIKLFPDFAGAKQNLEACEKSISGANKPASKPKQ